MTSDTSTDRTLLLVLVALAVLVLVPVSLMAVVMHTMGMMGGHWGDGSGVGIAPLWALGSLLLWLLVLATVGYLLYRWLTGGPGSSPGSDPALEALRLAYARGELDDEEFEKRRRRLRRGEGGED